MEHTRRDFLKKSAALGIAGAGIAGLASGLERVSAMAAADDSAAPFSLPPLPYGYDALEPSIDRMTMEIHYTKHHQGYVNNLNKACAEGKFTATLEELLRDVTKYPVAVRNNGGGHWNHSFFWQHMAPGKEGRRPEGQVAEALSGAFGSVEDFMKQFSEAGMKRFGSGWAWLVKTKDGKLQIGSTPNQDNPLMPVSELQGIPLLGVDVWEHAYYLKYQNKRGDYLAAWWNVVNWDEVAKHL